MKKTTVFGLIIAVLAFAVSVNAYDVFECKFMPGAWNKNDFIGVKSSRWEHIGSFRQEANHIVNVCPKDATDKDMLSKRAGETYAALVYKNPITGNSEIKADMSFDYRMAPSIVLAGELGKGKNNYPEFREHYEIVLYDQGINVWHHWFENGKQVWKKAGFVKATFQPKVKYEMEVEVKFTAGGTLLEISVGEVKMHVMVNNLPRTYYAGIIGCEGLNRFYEFEIEK